MPVLLVFFLIFIFVPLVELYVIISIGENIGALSTIALIVLTAVIGAFLVQQQGLSILGKIRETLNRGETPALEVLEGALLLLTGILLLLPGFITDAIGFALLIPPLRRFFILGWLKHSRAFTATKVTIVETHVKSDNNKVLQGEFRRED